MLAQKQQGGVLPWRVALGYVDGAVRRLLGRFFSTFLRKGRKRFVTSGGRRQCRITSCAHLDNHYTAPFLSQVPCSPWDGVGGRELLPWGTEKSQLRSRPQGQLLARRLSWWNQAVKKGRSYRAFLSQCMYLVVLQSIGSTGNKFRQYEPQWALIHYSIVEE